MAKRVTGMCIYHGTKLYKFVVAVTSVGEVSDMGIELYNNRDGEDFDTFNELYSRLLKLLKNNNFYAKSFSAFNRVFYDIYFIDYENPTLVDNYGYNERHDYIE